MVGSLAAACCSLLYLPWTGPTFGRASEGLCAYGWFTPLTPLVRILPLTPVKQRGQNFSSRRGGRDPKFRHFRQVFAGKMCNLGRSEGCRRYSHRWRGLETIAHPLHEGISVVCPRDHEVPHRSRPSSAAQPTAVVFSRLSRVAG